MKIITTLLFLFITSASFGQDTLTQTLAGDTIGSILVDCASDYDTELFRLQGDLRKPADYGDSATAAYSLRYVTDSYDSVVVRVRRSSDNAELDFYPQHIGDSLESWVGGENLLTYSEEFDNADWNKVRSTITINTTISPDGTANADKLVDNATNGTHTINNIISSTAGTSYSISVFAKADDLSYLLLFFDGSGKYFDLTNGVALGNQGTAPSSHSITDMGNGWFLCKITAVASTTATKAVQIYLSEDGTSFSYSGSSRGVFLWGAQVVEGSEAKPYVKTEANPSGIGYVTTWYDQMNGNHATQATAANQPKLVDAGSLVTENGKPAVDFDGTAINLTTSAISEVTQPATHVGVLKYKAGETSEIPFSSISEANGRNLSYKRNSNYAIFAGNVFESTTAVANDQQSNFTIFDGANSSMWKNNTLIIDNEDAGTETIEGITIGSDADLNPDFFGKIQEYIVYPSDQSSNRTKIESEINSYYNIASTIPDLTVTRIIRQSDSLKLVTGQVDTTFIGLPTQEDRIALTWESNTIRVSLNGADVVSKGVNYTQDYEEWFFSTQRPVTYYELIRWAIRLTNNEIKTLTR